MVQGIILAGGKSTRTGQNKLALSFHGQSILRHTILSVAPFVHSVIVVAGHYYEDIKKDVEGMKHVHVVYNEMYESGMFSSVQKGLRCSSGDVFILPGDCPFVLPSTFTSLLNGTAPLRVPSYLNRFGHPLFMTEELAKLCLQEPPTSNLRQFRQMHPVEIVEVMDEAILHDMDTLEDYETLIKWKGVL
jgi:molybdenum cofactor cytidylyltransferase